MDDVSTGAVVDPASVCSLDSENTISSPQSVDLAVVDSHVFGLPKVWSSESSRNSDGALECTVDASSMGVHTVPVPESPHVPRWRRRVVLPNPRVVMPQDEVLSELPGAQCFC